MRLKRTGQRAHSTPKTTHLLNPQHPANPLNLRLVAWVNGSHFWIPSTPHVAYKRPRTQFITLTSSLEVA